MKSSYIIEQAKTSGNNSSNYDAYKMIGERKSISNEKEYYKVNQRSNKAVNVAFGANSNSNKNFKFIRNVSNVYHKTEHSQGGLTPIT